MAATEEVRLTLPNWGTFTLRAYMGSAMDALRKVLPEEDRRNGLFVGAYALVDSAYEFPNNLVELETFWVYGEANDDQKDRAKMWMRKKAFTLAEYIFDYDPFAVSAFQANPDREKHRKGGAIRIECLIRGAGTWQILLSAAGIQEKADEAYLLTLARYAQWEIHPGQLDHIASISNNPYYRRPQAA